MENTSKALLIAAAVLTVILIITIGIKVYTSSSETGKVAVDTGKTILDQTRQATDLANYEITGNLPVTEDNIIKQIKNAYKNYKNSGSVGSVSNYIKDSLEKTFNDSKIDASDRVNKVIVSVRKDEFYKEYELNLENEEVKEYKAINYGNKTKETLEVGDDIIIGGTEKFRVFSKTDTEIKAIPFFNLKLDSDPMRQATIQEASAGLEGRCSFSTTNYWNFGEKEINMKNSKNLVYKYIKAYNDTLKDMGFNETVKIPIKDDVTYKSGSVVVLDNSTNGILNPGGIKDRTYWVGSSEGNIRTYVCCIWIENTFLRYYSKVMKYNSSCGVRPIIIIKK